MGETDTSSRTASTTSDKGSGSDESYSTTLEDPNSFQSGANDRGLERQAKQEQGIKDSSVTDYFSTSPAPSDRDTVEKKGPDGAVVIETVEGAKQHKYFKPGAKIGIRRFYDPEDPKSSKKISGSMIYLEFYNFFMSMSFGLTQIMSRRRLSVSKFPTLYWAISMSLWCLVQILFNLPIGRLCDVFGRVRPLAICAVIHGGCLIGYAFAYVDWAIIVARVCCGITDSTLIALLAYVSDVTPASRKASSISLLTTVNQASSLLIMMVVSFSYPSLGETGGKYFPIVIGAIDCLFGFFLPLFVVEPASRYSIPFLKVQYAQLKNKKRTAEGRAAHKLKEEEHFTKEDQELMKKLKNDISAAKKEYTSKIKKRGRWIKIIGKMGERFRSLGLMSAATALTTFSMFSVFAVLIDSVAKFYSPAVILSFSYQMLGGIVAMLISMMVVSPPVMIKIGPNKSVSIGVSILIIGTVIFGFIPEGQMAGSIIAFFCLCFGFGMTSASFNTMFSFWGDPDERGLIAAILIFCRDVGRCLAPIISVGFFQIHFSISYILAIISGLVAVVLVQYYVEPPATKDRLIAMSLASKEKKRARRMKIAKCCSRAYRSNSKSGHFRVTDNGSESDEAEAATGNTAN